LARFQSAALTTPVSRSDDRGRPLWMTIEYLANSPTHAPQHQAWPLPRLPARQLLERLVADGVLAPVLVVEVPPLRLVHREALRLHRPAQQVAVPALKRRAPDVVRVRAVRHLVVAADHLDRLAGLAVVQRQIDGAAAVVPRPLLRVGD